ncbi:DNA cytosine methyltransferase [Sphaerochaeta globosa]|uniref:DNA (cytosine-5-)-methyltransferase n=1 Tax=Sphaerochaeta globosa (strain ATCC BAA-1886 / DSM 22777 / Buddy) TaxID=158189 RepID=F0RW24_SPHGB|nr:DNA cytosine methyltransferase [Sphaerochaeta globosa]ADY13310.1 DNA-cytosine methyltransferase [Sphaerochaeta globosa str. Buddy]
MSYRVLDLFAGAGGLSQGFKNAGNFSIAVAIENNKYAQETCRENHKETTMLSDVLDYSDFSDFKTKYGEFDVVIGGPPCQGFSNANRQHNQIINLNNLLVKKYIEFIEGIKPKVFVMENVKMIRSKTHFYLLSAKDIDSERFDKALFRTQVLCLPNIKYEEALTYNIDHKMQFHSSSILLLKKKIRTYEKGTKVTDLDKFRAELLNLISEDKDLNNLFLSDVLGYALTEIDSRLYDRVSSFVVMEELSKQKIYIKEMRSTDAGIELDCLSIGVEEYITNSLNQDYEITADIYNTVNFGVPQLRERFVMIGVLKQLKVEPRGPERTITLEEDYRTVGDAIRNLENYEPGYSENSKGIKVQDIIKNENNPLNKLFDSDRIYNHFITNTTEVALQRFALIEPGKNFHSLDAKYTKTYAKPERTQNSIYRRLEYDKPCPTVTNVRKSMWIHPKFNRAISIREAARLQSFPDSFVFKGTKDRQYQQVGNAVPPLFATAIAKTVLLMLSNAENNLSNSISEN